MERLRRAYADPRIVWLGQVQAADFWPMVDVLVAPSVWAEPFGRVVVEAVQQGRGVIASRIGGLLEAASGAGAAALVEPGDEGALATALRDLLTDADRLAVLRAEAPSVAAAWSPERSLAALTGVVAEVSARPSRRA